MKTALCTVLFVAGCSSGSSGTAPLLDPPKSGYQLVIGPFSVPAGSEVQLCQTRKLPNDEPIALHSIDARKTLGSHHLILFKSDQDFPDQTFPCWGVANFEQWDFVADVQQKEELTWPLPDGHAIVLAPHQQIMLQSHYVNATTVQAPEGALSFVNLNTIPMDQVTHTVGSMFTVNTNIYIPPHSGFTNERDCKFTQPSKLVAMTGHFHARGLTFKVWRLDFFGNASDQIYESDDWNDPPFQNWDTPLDAPYGIRFSCSYFNDTDNPIAWGAHADVQEHCNLFFHYTPENPVLQPDLNCKNGSGGW